MYAKWQGPTNTIEHLWWVFLGRPGYEKWLKIKWGK
jgi:hypothetical protein